MIKFLETEEHRNEFLGRVPVACDKAKQFKDSFEKYAYLWNDDRNEFMKIFLTFGRAVSAEELESMSADGLEERPKVEPTLDQFKHQV